MASTSIMRHEVHSPIDEIMTDEEILALREFLDRLQNASHPVERALLRASLREPEDLSEDERAALREAEEEYAKGDFVLHEDIRRDVFGERDE